MHLIEQEGAPWGDYVCRYKEFSKWRQGPSMGHFYHMHFNLYRVDDQNMAMSRQIVNAEALRVCNVDNMTFCLRLLSQHRGVDDLQNKGMLFHVTACDPEKGWMFRRGMEGNIEILPNETFSRERFESLPHYDAHSVKYHRNEKVRKGRPVRDNYIWGCIDFLKSLAFMARHHELKLTPGRVFHCMIITSKNSA